VGRAPGNATNPQTGSGAQQTRDTEAEQPVEGVRNPEDGTGFDGSHHRTEGSASFREWTRRRRTAGGWKAGESQERKNSDLLGGREEFWQRRERSEGEEKITEAKFDGNGDIAQATSTGPAKAEDLGRPRGPGRQRSRSRRRRERRTTRYHVHCRGIRSAPPVRPPRSLEGPFNSTRADRPASAGRNPVSAESSVGTLPRLVGNWKDLFF
jgi:hypothetical protein